MEVGLDGTGSDVPRRGLGAHAAGHRRGLLGARRGHGGVGGAATLGAAGPGGRGATSRAAQRLSTTLPAVCSILNPVAGTVYVMVEGVSNTASLNLRVDVLTK